MKRGTQIVAVCNLFSDLSSHFWRGGFTLNTLEQALKGLSVNSPIVASAGCDDNVIYSRSH